MTRHLSDALNDSIPFIMEGQVMSNADPDQMGRVKLWVPSLDGENFDIDMLPWAEYASPFMGFTVEYPGGAASAENKAHSAYGFWAIPKVGATVLIFCLNADPTVRFYFASTPRLHRNRSLPAGRNTDFNGNPGPFGDDGDASGNLTKLQPAYDNLREQFDTKVTQSEAVTRGAWERQVAQHTTKDGKDGYAQSPVDTYLDPQTYCISTPGRHAIIMQDEPAGARLRFKTGEGHQIIFDDANERIYMSTARGRSWVELDQDGHINIYGADCISITSGKDINLKAKNNINISADNAVHIKAINGDFRASTGASMHLKAMGSMIASACGILDINSEKSLKITAASNIDVKSGADLLQTAGRNTDILSGGNIKLTGSRIDLNGPAAASATAASCAVAATDPSVIPQHEPWTRPTSTITRNKNWRK